jgi:hypothetical protein
MKRNINTLVPGTFTIGVNAWEKVKLLDGADDPAYDLERGFDSEGRKLGFTTIEDGISKVRFNATDVGGDNYVVRASLVWADQPASEGRNDETGVMTVWKRIHIEHRQMLDLTLPIEDIQDYLSAAFVEVKTYPVQSVAEEHDVEDFGIEDVAYDNVEAFCGPPPAGEFHNRKDLAEDGGWHLVVAARHFQAAENPEQDDPPPNPVPFFVQAARVSPTLLELADGEQDLPTGDGGLIGENYTTLTVNSELENEWTFEIEGNAARSITVSPFWFSGYRWDPRGNSNSPFVNQTVDLEFDGIGLGTEPVWVKISANTGRVAGIAPRSPTSEIYSDANALVFVKTIEEIRGVDTPEFADTVLGTLIHELTHSFGLTHRCGLADITGIYSCEMNYSRRVDKGQPIQSQPILSFSGEFLSAPMNTTLSEDRLTNLCAQHLIAIRRAKGFGGEIYDPN